MATPSPPDLQEFKIKTLFPSNWIPINTVSFLGKQSTLHAQGCVVSFKIFRLNDFEKQNQFKKKVSVAPQKGLKTKRNLIYYFFASSGCYSLLVNGVRNFDISLSSFHPETNRDCVRVSLLSQVTLQDAASKEIYCKNIPSEEFTQIYILPLIITRNTFQWNSCFWNYFFLVSRLRLSVATWNSCSMNLRLQ